MKNLTKLAALACAIFIGSNAYAQKINAVAGFNLSNFILDTEDDFYDPKIKPGFHVGASIDVPITDLISVDAGLLLNSMGFRADETISSPFGSINFEGKANLYYLTVPILAKANFEVGGVQSFVGVGPYMGIGLFGNLKSKMSGFGESEESDEKVEWGNTDDDDFERFDFGLQAKAGVEFDQLSVAFFYGLGLLNIAPNALDDASAKNTVFGLTVGYTLFEL